MYFRMVDLLENSVTSQLRRFRRWMRRNRTKTVGDDVRSASEHHEGARGSRVVAAIS
jgi:hypothetical protein